MTKQPTRNGSVGHIRRILHLARAALYVLLFGVFGNIFVFTRQALFSNRAKAFVLLLFLVLPATSVFFYTRGNTPAQAATSSTLNFQMRLLNASGNIVPDGNYHIEFKLYNAANSTGSSQGNCTGDSNCLWTETRSTGNLVRVVNGYFSVNLGSVTAFPSTINWDQEHWLGVRIGGTSGPSWETIELTSDGTATGNKIKLTAVPYAFRAGGLQASSGANELKVDLATPTADVTYTFQDAAAGSYNVCTTASVCSGYQASPASGSYLQQVPTATATNTVTPTANSVVALTVNGTSGTAATAVNVVQGGAATGLAITSSNTGTGQTISLTNASGTQAAGLLIDRNNAGGTTTDLLRLQNTAGTVSNGLTFSGTFTNLISSSTFSVNNGGAVVSASTGEFQGASVTVGTASTTNGSIVLRNSTNAFTVTLNAPSQTVGSATFSFPNTSGVGDTICLQTLSNCAGTGDIVQNGNSFGANITIGSNDNYDLNLESNGINRVTVQNDGEVFFLGATIYSTGTAYQSGTTVTGVGTTWTSSMVGHEFVFSTGQRATITAFGSTTSLTVDTSQTVSSNPGIAYSIRNRNFSVNATGSTNIRTSTDSTTAFQVQDASGDSIFRVDTSNDEVEVGVASDTTGRVVLYNSAGAGSITLVPANPGASNYTITFPAETGTVCTTGSVCSGYQAAGSYINASLTDNIADALDIQEGTNNYININTTNSSENISFGNTTTNPGFNFLGSGTVAIAGGLTVSGTYNTNTFTSTGLTFGGAGAAAIASAAGQNLTINSGTTGTLAIGDDASAETINFGTGAAAKTLTLGSTNTTSSTTIQSGSGDLALTSTDAVLIDSVGLLELNSSGGAISIGNDAVANAIDIGTGAAARTITIGNNTGATALDLTAGTGGIDLVSTGTGDITLNSSDTLLLDSAGALEINSSAGAISIGNDAVAQAINIGTGAAARTITIGNTTGATGLVLQAGTGGITFGSGAGQGQVTNNGSTVNSTLALSNDADGGVIGGTAAATIDIYTSISLAQTTASQTFTLATPTASTAYGRVVYLSNIGTASFSLYGSNLEPGSTAALVWSNTNGGASWQYSGTGGGSGSYIQNQNSVDQTANFRISGTGRANTSFTAPLFDSISGALSIGTSTATGVTIGGTTNTTSVLLQGAAAATYTIGTSNNTGGITLGNSTASNTISIGTAAGNGNTQTINIGTSATAGSITTTTIGSAIGTSSTTIQGGTGATAVNIQAGATGSVNIANNAVDSTVNIGKTGATANTTTVNIATSTGAAQTIYIGGTGGAGANSNTSTTVTAQGGATSFTVANAGSTVRTFTDTTTAFQVQNASATSLFSVDTTNSQINLVRSVFSGNILPAVVATTQTTNLVTTTIDSGTISANSFTSTAIGTDGLPIVSYRESSLGDLKVAKCTVESCSSGTIVTTVDSTDDVGSDSSIAIGADGLPVISYYDSTNGNLKVTKCGNPSCTSGNTTSTAYSDAQDVGYYTSIAIGNDGYPVISFHDGDDNDLFVTKCGNASCSSGNVTTAVETSQSVGHYSSLAIGNDGYPVIAHFNDTNDDLMITKCSNTDCSSDTTTNVDSATQVGQFSSLAIGSDGYPIVAYYDLTGANLNLKVIKCGDAGCTTGNTITTVDSTNDVGTDTSITVGTDGLPVIAYRDSTNTELKVTKCGNLACSSGNTTTVVDTTGNAGNDASIAVLPSNLPVISYIGAGDLRISRCGNASCSGSASTLIGGLDIGTSTSAFQNGYINNIRAGENSGLNFATGGANRLTIGLDGATTLKSQSVNALRVQDATGTTVLNVDTINARVGINTTTPSTDLAFGEGANRTVGVEARASNAAGRNLTISAGAAGAGASAFGGGTLTLQGGAAAGTGNAVGGSVVISGGAGVGTGVQGLVNIYPASFTSSGSTQSYGVNSNLTGVDSYSTIAVNATTTGLTITLPVPHATNQVVGRVVYVTAVDNSNDFTLSLGGTSIAIAMKENSTATLIWNGTGWTAAGASSSTDLQSAYNNTLTSAGGAELVLNPSGGAADGLTIRNNGTTPIIGGILEAQTSIGSNLFSVNNNATEYANNGGAESSTFTMWTGTPTGGTIARNTTLTNVATGTASTSVTTTATIGHGVENTLSSTLTNALKYQVSFAIKADSAYSAFSTLDVMYSYDGSALRHCVAGTPYYSTGTASQSGTTITGSGTTFTSAMVGKTFVYANGTSTVISGYTSATQLTAATSQTVSSQNFGIYDAGFSVKNSVWSRVTCFFTAPPSGTTITASNSVMIRQTDATARVFYIDNLSVTVSADVNHAVDGSVDDSTNFASNWSAYDGDGGGAGTSSTARDTTVIYDTSASARADTSNHADMGIRNNMTITPAASTQYLVSFYARSGTGAINDLTVRYSEDGGTGFVSCVDYNTQAITTSAWTKITCLFTADSSVPGSPNPDLIFTQNTAPGGTRSIYIDALSITLNNNNSNNIQIGGANRGGPTTLLTLDRSANAPIAANNDAYLGSMYYDTTTGRIQCYEADGWGACGSAPDNYVNLNPEYAGAVLNGTGVGTMTADFCANQSGILQINYVNSTDPCFTAGDVRNYYKWTSPQATQQTYSIYVTYQLPATFKGFSSDDTVQLVARADSTTNAAVTYQMFRSENGVLTQCGTGETTVVTSTNTWQSVGINGNEATSCNFSTSSANAFLIFKINMKANSNANAYVSTLSFITTGR